MKTFGNFTGSVLVTLACLLGAGVYGWHDTGSAEQTLAMLWIVLVLAVLEISLSFDNAVVNAAVLTEMDRIWRKRFLTWGMAITVFGTRVLFPLAIVGLAAGLTPVEALTLSLEQPARYEQILRAAHPAISGFGGAFLVMVGLRFFLDSAKDVHWLTLIELPMQRLGAVRAGVIVLLLALTLIARTLGHEAALSFLISAVLGLVTFLAVETLGSMLENGRTKRASATLAKAGLGSFIYLNLLDASFSLDGVIGAFALSNDMIIIALGLTIGAVFVRSLTMVLVDRGTLGHYRYLEHGAFWAITVLGAIMLISVRVEVPETVTGVIGAVLIGLAVWSSRRHHAG